MWEGCTGRNWRLNTKLPTCHLGLAKGRKKQTSPKSRKWPSFNPLLPHSRGRPTKATVLPGTQPPLSWEFSFPPWLSSNSASFAPTLCPLFFSLYTLPGQSWPQPFQVHQKFPAFTQPFMLGAYLIPDAVLTVEDIEISNRHLFDKHSLMFLICASHYLRGWIRHCSCHHGAHRLLE